MYKNTGGCTLLNPNVWQDVRTDIELKILSGTFAAGERIPSIRKIAEDYGVGQSTAQKALNALWHQGIIEAKRGVGFYVKPYIREQLLLERKKRLEKKVADAVEEAALVDVDLVSMVQKYTNLKGQKDY